MFSAKTYFSNHSVQVQGVERLLQKFTPKMKWTNQHKIIDIGCGPGDVTHNFLLPLIPTDGELVGVDICKSMIDIANNKYADSRSRYEVMDATKSEITEKYTSYFDSAFSFYCMNWFQDQKSAMENIYSILKPGGNTLNFVVVDAINYLLFETLAESPKWFPYMLNFKEAISPYRSSADPVSDIRNLMLDVGFQVEECCFELQTYTFQSKLLCFKWLNGINPFRNNIPTHLLQEFDQECEKIALCENFCTLNDATDEITIFYTTISCFARKPQHVDVHSCLPEL